MNKTNDDLMKMIFIALLKLTRENKDCKGIMAECEFKGIKYKLVFAPSDDFKE